MTSINRTNMDSPGVDLSSASSAALWRTATDPSLSSSFDNPILTSWRDHHPHDLVSHHDYSPFRFPDHHPYDSTANYYTDATMDSYAASSAAAAAAVSVYSPYMVHHHHHHPSPPPNSTTNSSSIKPETAVTALQSALGLSNPMNVNVSMNFNSHNIQYATGYNLPPSTSSSNLSYDSFYSSNRHSIPSPYHHSHHPHHPHHNGMTSEMKHRTDPMAAKQAMLLSAAANSYDYKDLSKLCEFFPTPTSSAGSSTSSSLNDKRNSWLPPQSGSSKSLTPKTNEGRVNRCRTCGKVYARPSTLKTHLRTHSGEKPYKCNKCPKAFTQAANLTAHERTHSGEKPFGCDICGRKFSQSSSVTTHMRTHSGERPYQCKCCRKAFSDSSTLTKHMRVHSGEKPYECGLCHLRFSQSGNLNRHMRIHANGNATISIPIGHHGK